MTTEIIYLCRIRTSEGPNDRACTLIMNWLLKHWRADKLQWRKPRNQELPSRAMDKAVEWDAGKWEQMISEPFLQISELYLQSLKWQGVGKTMKPKESSFEGEKRKVKTEQSKEMWECLPTDINQVRRWIIPKRAGAWRLMIRKSGNRREGSERGEWRGSVKTQILEKKVEKRRNSETWSKKTSASFPV